MVGLAEGWNSALIPALLAEGAPGAAGWVLENSRKLLGTGRVVKGGRRVSISCWAAGRTELQVWERLCREQPCAGKGRAGKSWAWLSLFKPGRNCSNLSRSLGRAVKGCSQSPRISSKINSTSPPPDQSSTSQAWQCQVPASRWPGRALCHFCLAGLKPRAGSFHLQPRARRKASLTQPLRPPR